MNSDIFWIQDPYNNLKITLSKLEVSSLVFGFGTKGGVTFRFSTSLQLTDLKKGCFLSSFESATPLPKRLFGSKTSN